MKSCRKAGPWKDIAKSSIKSSQKQVLDAVPLLVAPVSILEASTRLGLPAGEFSGSPTVPTDKSPAIGPDNIPPLEGRALRAGTGRGSCGCGLDG